MLYEAKSKSNKLLIKIEKSTESSTLSQLFKGIFQIEKNDNGHINKYVSNIFTNSNEWDLVRTLLFHADFQLIKMNLGAEGFVNVIWDKFFDSKQPMLIQY